MPSSPKRSMAFAMIPVPTEVVGAHGTVRVCCRFMGPIPERTIVADARWPRKRRSYKSSGRVVGASHVK
jgi:hypothetical protein